MTEVLEPRLLRAHKATTTCCVASSHSPPVIATAAEDGCICCFDLRCTDVLFTVDAGNHNAISSLCFKPGNENVLYASWGNEVKSLDIRMADSLKLLENYNYNKDEINQIVCNSKSTFLAAVDDSGDVKIIDIRQQCPYKTLRAGHANICSSVQFLPWRPWEVITGGLDSKLVMWDFSKGRAYRTVDFGSPETGSSSDMGQSLNPPFVHALAVPEVDLVDKVGKVCAVARGDGVVNIIDLDSVSPGVKSKKSSTAKKGSQLASNESGSGSRDNNGVKMHIDYTLGGHSAAVSCVTFSMFGEKGKFIISGGNDKSVKIWSLSRCTGSNDSCSGSSDLLHLNINMRRKVNWLCTTPMDSDNLVVCDTSKVVKVYSIV